MLEPGQRACSARWPARWDGPGTRAREVLSVAFGQGFSDEFPPEVMDEADAFALKVTEEEATEGEDRRDLRPMPLVTIDGEDARDFDDAVYAEPSGHAATGWWWPSPTSPHYVREHSPLDAEALDRATSVYLPDRVLPMLPERLSNGICSLRPDEDRLCMVADMSSTAPGSCATRELYPAVMRSAGALHVQRGAGRPGRQGRAAPQLPSSPSSSTCSRCPAR